MCSSWVAGRPGVAPSHLASPGSACPVFGWCSLSCRCQSQALDKERARKVREGPLPWARQEQAAQKGTFQPLASFQQPPALATLWRAGIGLCPLAPARQRKPASTSCCTPLGPKKLMGCTQIHLPLPCVRVCKGEPNKYRHYTLDTPVI